MNRLRTGRREVGRGELGAPAAQRHLAADHDLLARAEATLDVPPAEPDRLGAAALVAELGDDALWTPPEALLDTHVADRDAGRLLLVRHEVSERPKVAKVVVAEREGEERLAWRLDPQPSQRCK